jgi:hypothetical protein
MRTFWHGDIAVLVIQVSTTVNSPISESRASLRDGTRRARPPLYLRPLTRLRVSSGTLRMRLCLPIERDRYFVANKPLSAYANAARESGFVET